MNINTENLIQLGLYEFNTRKAELEIEYKNFLEFYDKQREKFQKISNDQTNNYAELYNFISNLFSESNHEVDNILLKLLDNQQNFINQLAMNFPTPHWHSKGEKILKAKPPIDDKNSIERKDSLLNKKQIHMELQAKLIDKFTSKIQAQDNLIKILTKENSNLRVNLETLLRKTLIRNLPHHFGKKFYSAAGLSSNYNSQVNVSNMNFNTFHTNITQGNLYTKGNLISESFSLDTVQNHSPKKNEMNSTNGSIIKEKRLTVKINDYIENVAGKRQNITEKKKKFW